MNILLSIIAGLLLIIWAVVFLSFDSGRAVHLILWAVVVVFVPAMVYPKKVTH